MIKKTILALCCCILLIIAVVSDSQTKKSPQNKISGNPVLRLATKDKYERFSGAYKSLCAKELSGEHDSTIYAHIRSGGAEYFAVMGYFNSSTDEYNEGEILEIQGNKCQQLDLGWTLMSRPPRNGYSNGAYKETFPGNDSPRECSASVECHPVFRSANEELLLGNFVKDAIQRAVASSGGDAPFRAQACKPEEEKALLDTGFIVVLQEIKNYCSNIPGKSVWSTMPSATALPRR
jgi:hypothetical protein